MYIKKSIKCLFNEDKDCDHCHYCTPKYGIPHPNCSASLSTDEFHGWECTIIGGECMFLIPNSKACAEKYDEGPDKKRGGEVK